MSGRTNPRTAVIEVRTDSRLLAAIALFLKKKGEKAASKSALVHCALDVLTDILVSNGLTTMLTSTEAAEELLHELGYGDIRRSGRGGREYIKQIQLEEKLSERTNLSSVEPEEEELDALVKKLTEASEE